LLDDGRLTTLEPGELATRASRWGLRVAKADANVRQDGN
jgi:hypothetical protein